MNNTKRILAFVYFVAAIVMVSYSQSPLDRVLPSDNTFFNPDIKVANKLTFPEGSNSSCADLQAVINKLAKKGGGVLTIKTGTYRLIGVYMRSNVHIRIEPKTILKPDGQGVMFNGCEKGSSKATTNWSVQSTNDKRFTVDLSELKPMEGVRVFAMSNVRNFKIADFDVLDNYTKFSCVTFGTETVDNKILFATKGIIENIVSYKGHYGYGIVQCQVGQDLLFRNLKGEGGAALRLESGLAALANLKCDYATIDRIFARNIECANGQCAVTMSPHVIKQGWVDIRDVKAVNCEAGAVIAAGFLSKKKNQSAETGFTAGTFSSESVISNMNVVYGDSAQIRPSRLIFIPCNLRCKIVGPSLDQESIIAPSIAPVFYNAAGKPNGSGHYTVVLDRLTYSGFSNEIPADGLIIDEAKCAFKNCGTPLPVFEKSEHKTEINKRGEQAKNQGKGKGKGQGKGKKID